MNSKQRYNAKRASEHRAKKATERQFEKKIVSLLTGCSTNVFRAISAPDLREKHEDTSVRLSGAAPYAPRSRKIGSITAR